MTKRSALDMTDSELAAWISLHNAVRPDHPMTVAELVRADRNRPDDHVVQRLLLRDDVGNPVAATAALNVTGVYHPQRFMVWIFVSPERRGEGHGRRAWTEMMAALAPHEPRHLMAHARESEHAACAFLERLGFCRVQRMANSVLELATVPAAVLVEARARVAETDVRLLTLRDLAASLPDWKRRVWRHVGALQALLPGAHEIRGAPFDYFVKQTLDSPHLSWDESWFAMVDDALVGMSSIWFDSVDATARHTGLTGVFEAYQRRGIATALKCAVIESVLAAGGVRITTENLDTNPMLQINRRLGFVAQPATLDYELELADTDSEDSVGSGSA